MEKQLSWRFSEVSYNESSLNVWMIKFKFFESFDHFLLIPSYHTYIESESSKLFTEPKADAITATRNNNPWVVAVPFPVVFLRQYHFD